MPRSNMTSTNPIPPPVGPSTQTSDNFIDDDGGRWHIDHKDPVLDVILQSKDRVRFRASSYKLRTESTNFKDSIESSDTYRDSSDAIDFSPLSSTSIAMFLDACMTSTPISHAGRTLFQLRDHRQVTENLGCGRRLHPNAKAASIAGCNADPLGWFKLASTDKDVESAKAALLLCGRGPAGGMAHEGGIQALTHLIPGTPLSWRYPLLLCLTDDTPTSAGESTSKRARGGGSSKRGRSDSISDLLSREKVLAFVEGVRAAEAEIGAMRGTSGGAGPSGTSHT